MFVILTHRKVGVPPPPLWTKPASVQTLLRVLSRVYLVSSLVFLFNSYRNFVALEYPLLYIYISITVHLSFCFISSQSVVLQLTLLPFSLSSFSLLICFLIFLKVNVLLSYYFSYSDYKPQLTPWLQGSSRPERSFSLDNSSRIQETRFDSFSLNQLRWLASTLMASLNRSLLDDNRVTATLHRLSTPSRSSVGTCSSTSQPDRDGRQSPKTRRRSPPRLTSRWASPNETTLSADDPKSSAK